MIAWRITEQILADIRNEIYERSAVIARPTTEKKKKAQKQNTKEEAKWKILGASQVSLLH